MNDTPLKIRTKRNGERTYMALTIRLHFGPGVHDTREFHAGQMLGADTLLEVQASLRKQLADELHRCIINDQWETDDGNR